MFNNDVTYDDKWDTPENLKALAEVERKYFDKSVCSPSCPASWAPEVLDLLNRFDKELGIEWNESTIRAWRVDGNLFVWLVKSPILSAFNAFKYHWVDKKSEFYKDYGFRYKAIAPIKAFFGRYAYAKNAIRVRYVAPVMNKILRPKFTLTQVKEKYGELNIYFHCPDTHRAWVEEEIVKCKIKLAMKGAYYPLEHLWDAKVSNTVDCPYDTEKVKVINYVDYNGIPQVKVERTVYRQLIKDMGIDIVALENSAAEKREKKNEQDSEEP